MLVQVLPGMISHATKVYHNVMTALPSYMAFEAFRELDHNNKVKDISYLTHELRWVKSSSEVNLMRQSASIACQVSDASQASLASYIFLKKITSIKVHINRDNCSSMHIINIVFMYK